MYFVNEHKISGLVNLCLHWKNCRCGKMAGASFVFVGSVVIKGLSQ
jgi:hypothetical protein